MRNLLLLLLFAATGSGLAQTNISAGNVFGKWKKTGSPYKINGNIVVPRDSTFRIESGVQVVFQGNYSLEVKGSIQALGSAGDTITFTSANKTNGWNGIELRKNTARKDSLLFNHCKFEYVNYFLLTIKSHGAIFADSVTKLHISNCLFQFNRSNVGVGLRAVRSSCVIDNCKFYRNNAMSNNAATPGVSGSAVTSAYSRMWYNNCIFDGNSAFNQLSSTDSINNEGKAALYTAADDTLVIRNSLFVRNSASGPCAIGGDLNSSISNYILIKYTNFYKNTGKQGIVVSLPSSTSTVNVNYENLHFDGNVFSAKGSGIIGTYGPSTYNLNKIKITNTSNKCLGIVADNTKISNSYLTGIDGVAVIVIGGNTTVVNSIITNNDCGGAVRDAGKLSIINTLVAYNGNSKVNSTDFQGGVIQGAVGFPRINLVNSIIQGNRVGGRMYNLMSTSGTIINTVKNNIIEGGKDSARALPSFNPLSFGIDTDNQNDTVWFVKAPKGAGVAFADTTCDFRVRNTCSFVSNTLNAGINANAFLSPMPETDYAGNKRIQCSKIDIGPYELEGAKKFVSIDQEPTDQKVCPNTAVVIAPTACGASLGYQWQKSSTSATTGFANIGSATAVNYTFTPKDSGWYRLIINQAECSKKDTSIAAKISFKPGSSIVISAQPRDTSICASTNFNLNATVQGSNNTSRWQNSKTSATTGFADIAGATTNPYSKKIMDSSWYRLIVKNTICNYEDTTKAAKVNKLPLPTPNLGADQTLANTANKVLNPGTFTTYQWSHPTSAPATTPTLTVDKNNLNVGANKVWVEVSNSYSCKGRDTINITLEAVNGVLNPANAGIKIYPIPANKLITIEVPDDGFVAAEIVNLNGQFIQSSGGTKTMNFNIENINPGVYLLKLIYKGECYSTKIIIN